MRRRLAAALAALVGGFFMPAGALAQVGGDTAPSSPKLPYTAPAGQFVYGMDGTGAFLSAVPGGGVAAMASSASNATAAALGNIVTLATGCNDVTKFVSGTGTCGNSGFSSLALLNNPSSSAAGNVPGVKIGIAAGTEPNWTNNPITGNFVAFYPYINSSNSRTAIWSINPIIDVFSGHDAIAMVGEFDLNNASSEVSTPDTALGKNIVSAVSGGTKRVTTGFESTASLTDGTNWIYNAFLAERAVNYGFWAHHVAGDNANDFALAAFYDDSNSATIFKAIGSHTSGIDLTGATISGNPFASTGFSVNSAGAISLTQASAGTVVLATLLNNSPAVSTTKTTEIDFRGFDTISTNKDVGAIIVKSVDQDWVASQLIFQTRNGDAIATAATLGVGLQVGAAPTGGDEGAGTINPAGAVYDNGTAPTGTAGSGYVRATSPALGGTPTAPTAAPGTNTTQLATTAFVTAGLSSGSGAIDHISYQPGLLTAVNATKAAFHKFSKATTVDNIEGSAATFSCVSNPTVTMFECGTSATCASSPVTIGTVTLTAAGAVVDGTINSAAITAGDYVAFAMTAGTCASVDLAVTVQTHVN